MRRTAHGAASREYFEALEQAILEKFAADGFSVIKHESGQGTASYSITKENTDGSVALFFGPIHEHGDKWRLPYRIAREADSHESEAVIPRRSEPNAAADLFLESIFAELTNRLPLAVPEDVGVGAGLLPVQELFPDRG